MAQRIINVSLLNTELVEASTEEYLLVRSNHSANTFKLFKSKTAKGELLMLVRNVDTGAMFGWAADVHDVINYCNR